MTTTKTADTAVSRPVAAKLLREVRLRTVPSRLRALALLLVVLIVAFVSLATMALDHSRTGLQVIGHKTGPVVAATGDLYFALSDMDAEISQVLLIGKERDLGTGRDAALTAYEQRRARADAALLEAAKLTAADPAAQTTARNLLQGLGRYESLAAQALVLNEQSAHPAGPPPAEVLDLYRQATDLMRLELLPQAYNLTLTSGTIVRHTYIDQRSAVLTGRTAVLVAGGLLLLVLFWLQFYLARIFRRVTNLALVLATACALGGVGATSLLLTHEADMLARAKLAGFDSVLNLSRARAISNNANADQGRFLLDPGRADIAAQTYLDKSQAVFYVPAGRLETYETSVDEAVAAYLRTHLHPQFLGFLGQEVRPPHGGAVRDLQPALDRLLSGYRRVQADDAGIRALAAEGRSRDAIEVRMNGARADFRDYDDAMVAVIHIHNRVFTQSIASGDDALKGWRWSLPGAALVVALLVLLGLRPRLLEFRK